MPYPSRVVLGASPTQRVYVLQSDRLVLRFDTHDGARIDEFLRRLAIEPEPARPGSGLVPSLTSDTRIVRVAPRGDGIDALARRLLSLSDQPANVVMATPVYHLDGAGPETGVSPVPGRLLVQFGRQVDEEARVRVADRLQLKRHAIASSAIAPFEMLVPASSNGSAGAVVHGAVAAVATLAAGAAEAAVPMVGDPDGLFELQHALAKQPEVERSELDWLWLFGLQFVSSETPDSMPWSMARIGMEAASELQRGAPHVVVAVVDSGVDGSHPHLLLTPAHTHFNATQAEAGPGPYDASPSSDDSARAHGTLVAGIIGASHDCATGAAGVAPKCAIMPIRVFPNATNARVAAGINWAARHGAHVVNLGLGGPSSAVVTHAIVQAWSAGLVLCAAAGNYMVSRQRATSDQTSDSTRDSGDAESGDPVSAPVLFPASHPRCIAVGATDVDDQRKRASAAEPVSWGSHWGPELDVMAPGVRVCTTRPAAAPTRGPAGRGFVAPIDVQTAEHGFGLMAGTSAAAAHVAGLAALLRLRYPDIDNQRLRDVIERTCAKSNPATYPYALGLTRPNGAWHDQMGYGRINAHAALTYADLVVRQHPFDRPSPARAFGDTGHSASAGFGSYQPYVTNESHPEALPSDHQPARAGQDNYVHVLVRNAGPADATNVLVTWHAMDFPGRDLMYPGDWNVANMIACATIPSLRAGEETTVEARWARAAVDVAAGYAHPCMVVAATAASGNGGQAGPYLYQHHNIAQHNIAFADADGDDVDGAEGRPEFVLPFAVGHRTGLVRHATVRVDLRGLNGASAYLDLSPDAEHPFVKRILHDARTAARGRRNKRGCRLIATEDTPLAFDDDSRSGTLVLRAGSSFTLTACGESTAIDRSLVRISNGQFSSHAGRELIALHGSDAVVEIPLAVGEVSPLAIVIVPPAHARPGARYRVDVTPFSEGVATGGISLEVQR